MMLVPTITVVTDQISPMAIMKITHIATVTICSSVMLYIIGLSFCHLNTFAMVPLLANCTTDPKRVSMVWVIATCTEENITRSFILILDKWSR
jgi:uncharacterized transporter YbjL